MFFTVGYKNVLSAPLYLQTIDTQLKQLYDTQLFKYEETTKYSLQTNNNKIVYEAIEFNLQIVIALSFRITSWQSQRIREWVLKNIQEQTEIRYCPN